MPVARTYNNNTWAASNTPAVAVPTPTPTEAPAPAAPVVNTLAPSQARGAQEAWWKTRGGHELYGIFEKIEKENPMAARAFWDAVAGSGHGMNDLQAATIHKKFGGDMNAYNNWRNLYHGNSMDSYAGFFDLGSGKWTPGAGFNSQYVKDRLGWDVSGAWQPSAGWDWGNFQNTMQPGLQSTPGNAGAGAESWNTYGYGATFSPTGVTYPSVYDQAVGSGIIAPTTTDGPRPFPTPRTGGTPTPNPTPFASPSGGAVSAPPSGFTAPPPTAAPNVPVPTATPTVTRTGTPSTTNPYGGDAGGYRYSPVGTRRQ